MSRRILAGLIGLGLVGAGCGDGGDAGGCEPAFQEQLDPSSGLHVIAGADVEFLTDPPTSGPHSTAATPTGAVEQPIARIDQVAILEAGRALVQFDDTVSADGIAVITAIEDGRVVSAPNPDLDDPIVVTAWTWKMTCSTADDQTVADILAFADAHAL